MCFGSVTLSGSVDRLSHSGAQNPRLQRGTSAIVFALMFVFANAACGGAVRTTPVPVYGGVRVQTGTREVPTESGFRVEPVYETRRQIVRVRQRAVRRPDRGLGFYFGGALDYRAVPDLGVMDGNGVLGLHVARDTVDHVLALRVAVSFAVHCPAGVGSSGGGGRLTYAPRVRLGQAYLGPEIGLGAVAAECQMPSRTTKFIEILGLGVVAGYRVGGWSIGGSLRLGLGWGAVYGSGYTAAAGDLEPDETTIATVVFGVETGYGF